MAKNHSNGSTENRNRQVPVVPKALQPKVKGTIVVIGGRESKDGHRPILEDLAKRVGSGKLVVSTMASEEPGEQWEEYSRVFGDLGVKRIEQLDARRREDLLDEKYTNLLTDATVVFFAGGDQLKIASRFGGTALCNQLRELYVQGATIAGTSSGASIMSDVMLVAGGQDESQDVEGSLRLAPGLGLLTGVIIDQHFAERGRMGRLIAAVAQNPRCLGIGIDEDTSVVFEGSKDFRVSGSGAVYVVDGHALTFTNAAEDSQGTLSAFGSIVHVLADKDSFSLETRLPVSAVNEKLNGKHAK
jgi:cyanophycinase